MTRFSIFALLLAIGFSACAPAEPEQPNILFIFTDDHAQAAISAYGSTYHETPNIDRLAREGALFQNCMVTNSICAPSRATILTGTYNHINGQMTNGPVFDGSQVTMPKLLQAAGYTTAMIGKWHLRSAPTGFDHYQILIDQGPYYNPPIRTATDTTVITGYTTDILTDLALTWLDEGRDPAKPFMLFFQHKAPHRNWQPGPDHLTMFDDTTFALPPTFYDDYATRSDAAAQANMRVDENLNANDLKITPQGRLNDEQRALWDAAYGPKNEALRATGLKGDDLDEWKFNRYLKDYLRAVQSVDDNIGRVLDYLDETGLAENTIVVYASDQGWYLGEHGWYDKRWMYEPSLKTPFIVKWPGGVTPGQVNETLVSNVDFAPTFLEIAGAEVPAHMQGKSLVPVLKGGTDPSFRDAFYYHYYEYPASHCVQPHYGVRTDRYKLIYFYGLDQWELFDLQADPDELNNVHGQADFAEIQAGLEVRLAELREELQVPDDPRPWPPAPCNSDAEGWDGFDEAG
ncbi:MAG: sulfatase [Bacteroidetes bacterium]|nr:sulfatase [Bacteroidota bacterium]